MTILRVLSIWLCYWVFAVLAQVQNVSTALSQHPTVSKFTSLLSEYPELIANVSAGNVTILAPTNTAFTGADDLSQQIPGDTKAALDYHVLQGLHTAALLRGPSQFIPSHLTDPAYSNVTGGQTVEVSSGLIYSGNKTISRIITADIPYAGGVIHIIDNALVVPSAMEQAATDANLNFLISALNLQGLLDASATSLFSALFQSGEVTAFIPNSENLTSNYSHLSTLTPEQQKDIFEYHLIRGSVDYSTTLKNQSSYMTVQGTPVTITIQLDGSMYVDAAKIISPDWLVASGTFHILDSLLDPSNPSARPLALISHRHDSGDAISKGAIAGIAVGGAAAVFLIVSLVMLYRRRKSQMGHQERARGIDLPPLYESKAELSATSQGPLQHVPEILTTSSRSIYELSSPLSIAQLPDANPVHGRRPVGDQRYKSASPSESDRDSPGD